MTTAPTLYDVRSYVGEVRMVTSTAGKRTIVGYAAVFNSRSQPLQTERGETFVETIRPGSFAKSAAEADVRGLFNHDPNAILGRRGAGTLRLSEDSRGLAYEIDLGTRSYDRDLEESLDRKDIIGSSFSFATIDDDWTDEGGLAVRQLRSVHLFDVGPVVFPAYRAATATCRSFTEFAEKRSSLLVPPPVFKPTPAQIQALNYFNLHSF